MEFVEENWLILSIVAGFVAKSIGRSFWKYFFLSLFLSPVVGFVVLLIKGRKTDDETNEDEAPAPQSTTSIPAENAKYCIDCGALLETNAKFCSNCGRDLGTGYNKQ